MTDEDILKILQADLNILSPDDAKMLLMEQDIQSAKAFMEREGVVFSTPYTIEDGQLIEMYAAHLFRKRNSGEEMPRMIRWALNNRIFGGERNESG